MARTAKWSEQDLRDAKKRMERKRVSGPTQAEAIAPHSRKSRTGRPPENAESGAGSNPALSPKTMKGSVDRDTRTQNTTDVAPLSVESCGSQTGPNSAGQAGAIPAPSSKFDSAWEGEYAKKLELDRQAGLIREFWYHPWTVYLPGKVKYTPDFLIQYPDGLERKLKIVELKGWSRNRRDGVTRYKIAAGIYDCFDWEMIEKQRGSWVTIS